MPNLKTLLTTTMISLLITLPTLAMNQQPSDAASAEGPATVQILQDKLAALGDIITAHKKGLSDTEAADAQVAASVIDAQNRQHKAAQDEAKKKGERLPYSRSYVNQTAVNAQYERRGQEQAIRDLETQKKQLAAQLAQEEGSKAPTAAAVSD